MDLIPAYERDPRLTSLETEVVSAGEADGAPFVVLADTVLYPEGGGQPADRGTVGGVPVLDVRRVGREVRHFLAGPPPAGRVTVELDWARRFDHMQQHTAQHLLTAVAEQRFGWRTTAFHLGERTSDIELDTPSVGEGKLLELEERVAAEIRAPRRVTARHVTAEEYAHLEVRSRGLPEGHTGDVRLVEIEGLDVNTCGGTHCRSTGELEALKVLGTEGVRGGTRLFYVAGRRLRRLHDAHHLRAARLRDLLGTSDDELVERAALKLEQLKAAERTIRDLEHELADACGAALAARPGPLATEHWPRKDLPFLQTVAGKAVRLAPDLTVLLTAGEGEEGWFLLAAGERSAVDVPGVGRKLAELLGGRGGGSGRVFQGKGARLSQRGEAARMVESAAGTHFD